MPGCREMFASLLLLTAGGGARYPEQVRQPAGSGALCPESPKRPHRGVGPGAQASTLKFSVPLLLSVGGCGGTLHGDT